MAAEEKIMKVVPTGEMELSRNRIKVNCSRKTFIKYVAL